MVTTIPTTVNTANLGTFDNVIDFGGTSGITFAPMAGSNNNTSSSSGAADLILFTGAGNINLPVNAIGNSSGTGSPSLVVQASISGGGLARVTYNYATNVPEPRIYGAIGAVACLGLLGYRRYRGSRQA